MVLLMASQRREREQGAGWGRGGRVTAELMHPLPAREPVASAPATLSRGAETEDREPGGEWSRQGGVKGLEFVIDRPVFLAHS